MKRRASVQLSFDVLAKVLNLSAELAIIGVRVDQIAETVDFILDGPTLPEAGKRQDIQRIPLSHAVDWELR